MTREEAIEVLKLVDENASCDDCLYYAQMEDCPTDEDCIIRQALDMAIQALQAQADGDYISRQDAIDAMTLSNINQNMDDLNDGDARKVKRSVQRILAQLPTVAIPSAEPCESCCNGNQEEKAKLCQKSYLAGMEHRDMWIPVSERYPSVEEQYNDFLVIDDAGRMSIQEFYLTLYDHQPFFTGCLNVVAWMPLPLPWKGE